MIDFERRFPSFMMAKRNLSRTKIRSGLAMLGVVIGVVAIAGLGISGVILQQAILQNVGSIGDELAVYPGPDNQEDALSQRTIKDLQRVASDSRVVSVTQRTQPIQTDARSGPVRASVFAVSDPGTLNATEGSVPAGRLRGRVLVGSTLAEQRDLGPGSAVTVNGTSYRVAGVLEEYSQFDFVRAQFNNGVIVPERHFGRVRGADLALVESDNSLRANETAVGIRESVNVRRDRVTVYEMRQGLESLQQGLGVVNQALVGIASISLLVAGVSILNVMLMSTVERRAEIGVLRAVGYQKRDILKILLTEATLLGLLGGLVGVACSLLLGLGLNQYLLDDPLAVFRPESLQYLAAAMAFALVTCVISGLYPAWKAANEKPVEALRS